MTKLEAIAQLTTIIDDELTGVRFDGYGEATLGSIHMRTVIACTAAIDALTGSRLPYHSRWSSVLSNDAVHLELLARRNYSRMCSDTLECREDEDPDFYALDVEAIDTALKVMFGE